tara:strand:+ start:368 stop:676 length:309 start_codon:yes stop_codon:yes gene_type:complete
MIHFSYTGQSETLCGEPQLEADLKDGKLCEDCITVMWEEQHRRNMLMPEIKKARKRLRKNGKAEAPKAKPVGWISPGEDDFFGPVENASGAVYLSHYLEASE